MSELAKEFGDRLKPYAKEAVSWLRELVARIKELPEWVKDAAVKLAVLTAAMGPLMVAIAGIAAVVLPLFITRMGRVMMLLSAFINPIGTAVVVITKLALEFGVVTTALSRFAMFFLRLAGPVGVAIALFLTFKDDVIAALKDVFEYAQETLGPKLDALFGQLGEAVDSLNQSLDDLASSELGQWISDMIDRVGEWIQVFIELGGMAVVQAIGTLLDNITAVLEAVEGVGLVISSVLKGDWVDAWRQAAQTVDSSVAAMLRSVASMMPGMRGVIELMEYAGWIKPKAPANSGGGGVNPNSHLGKMTALTAEDMLQNLPVSGEGKSYAEPDSGGKPKKARTTGSRRTGPSAAELEERREELKLQQQLNVARESGDVDAERRIERQLDLNDRIQAYERAGLSTAKAKVAAEKDLAELEQARAEARVKALASDDRQLALQVAQLRGDYDRVRQLERSEELEREIAHLKELGLSTTEAEAKAQSNLQELEAARADAIQRRLEDQKAAHEIEVARLRGDTDAFVTALEEAERLRQRIEELQSDGHMSESEARAQAVREGMEREQATITGTFRESFRSGLRAALEGNLGDFFEGWMKDRAYNALSSVLDRLADAIARLFSQNGSSGGFLGSIGSALGSVFGTSSSTGSAATGSDIVVTRGGSIGFDTGGEFQIKGFPGVDQNLLSLNGNPIAQVSQGEIVNVRKGAISMANDNGQAGDTYNYYTMPSDQFWAEVDGRGASQAGRAVSNERSSNARRRRRGLGR
ncbi:MAG: hypothetical protein VYD90_12850 [Pseudomonadota bacterium]|nr:hypothetical protein [Pseudomonadota bacterium]